MFIPVAITAVVFKIDIKPRRSRRGIHDGHDDSNRLKKRRVLSDNTVVYVVVKKQSLQGSGFRPQKHTYVQKHFDAQALKHELVFVEGSRSTISTFVIRYSAVPFRVIVYSMICVLGANSFEKTKRPLISGGEKAGRSD